jgi:hypothetical protein
MAKDTLLKEAIADAKAVKEAAIANAMLTLKEAFKPQLTSMLAAKLRNESDDVGGGDAMDEQNTLKSSEIGGKVNVDNPAPKEPSKAAHDSSDIENKGLETDTFGDGEGFDAKPIKEDIPLPPEGGEGPMAGGMGGGDEFGDEDEMNNDGLDLEAIIRELEADLLGGHGGGDEMDGMDDGMDDAGMDQQLDQENFTQAHDGKNPMAARSPLRTETAPNKGSWPEGDGAAPSAKDGVNGGKEVQPGAEQNGGEFGTNDFSKANGSVDEEVDLDEILREMEAENSVSESDEIATENVELKNSLREHREVIKLLRSRINEVTLLNSKLMFTTKIFRKFNLSEDQKKKVVEQLDRATTLREAKIVFTTLAETITNRMGSAGMRKPTVKITESASSTIGSTKPKSTTVLSEGSTQVARLQKLAGIKLNG